MAEQVCPGIHLLGRYSPYKCGCWVLEHGGEAAILEMPPGQEGRAPAWDDADRFVRERGLEVRWLLLSHTHIDHTFGFPFFRRRFREARMLVHRSFLEWYRRAAFDDVFYADERELSLGGELLWLMHAPKHSPEDTLVFFRGAVCTGDWSLGAWPDCNPLVEADEKVASLERVRESLVRKDYRVHLAFSAHGDEIRRDLDFLALLDEMLAYWRAQPVRRFRKGYAHRPWARQP